MIKSLIEFKIYTQLFLNLEINSFLTFQSYIWQINQKRDDDPPVSPVSVSFKQTLISTLKPLSCLYHFYVLHIFQKFQVLKNFILYRFFLFYRILKSNIKLRKMLMVCQIVSRILKWGHRWEKWQREQKDVSKIRFRHFSQTCQFRMDIDIKNIQPDSVFLLLEMCS